MININSKKAADLYSKGGFFIFSIYMCFQSILYYFKLNKTMKAGWFDCNENKHYKNLRIVNTIELKEININTNDFKIRNLNNDNIYPLN